MKIKFLYVLFLGFTITGTAQAETIYLKDGRVIKGKIINRGAYDVTVKEGMMPRKYYNDQILRIEQDVEAPVVEETPLTTPSESDMAALSKISPEKITLIKEFIEVSGIRQSIQTNIERIIAQAPAEKQTELKTVFNLEQIVQQMLPIYDKYYSAEELTEIIAFYKTPTGRKVIEVTPKILAEFMQVTVDAIKRRSQP